MPTPARSAAVFLLLAVAPGLAAPPAPATKPAPDIRTLRDAYFHKAIIECYEKGPHTNPKWNDLALEVLSLSVKRWTKTGNHTKDPNVEWALAEVGKKAIDAGCEDPMVLYHYMRAADSLAIIERDVLTKCTRTIRKNIRTSGYPPMLRVYALTKIALLYRAQLFRKEAGGQEVVKKLLVDIYADIPEMLTDEDFLQDEFTRICVDLNSVVALLLDNPEESYTTVRGLMSKGNPTAPALDYFDALVYSGKAWEARGGGWASEVTDEGWEQFRKHLEAAKKSLEAALKRDPNMPAAAAEMIDITRGLGGDPKEMEKWFKHAIAKDPDCYDAYRSKLFFLTPKWHGSEKAQWDFGRECLATKKWESRIPFLIIVSHQNLYEARLRELRGDDKTVDGYWKARRQASREFYAANPKAWHDLQTLFETYLKQYPDAVYDRTTYAHLAHVAGHHDLAQKQLDTLGDKAVYHYFGTRENLATFRVEVKEALKGKAPAAP
jgi:tetratricopeptide (TPR) repeat protein